MSNPDKICFKVTIENGCVGVSFSEAQLTASEFDRLIRKIIKYEISFKEIANESCPTGCRFDDKDCTPDNCIIRHYKDIAKQALKED